MENITKSENNNNNGIKLIQNKTFIREINLKDYQILNPTFLQNNKLALIVLMKEKPMEAISIFDLSKNISFENPFQLIKLSLQMYFKNDNFNQISIKELRNGILIIIENYILVNIYQISNLNKKYNHIQEIDFQISDNFFKNGITYLIEIQNYLIFLGAKTYLEVYEQNISSGNNIIGYNFYKNIELNKNYSSISGEVINENIFVVCDNFNLSFLNKDNFEKIKSIKLIKFSEKHIKIFYNEKVLDNNLVVIDDYNNYIYLISIQYKEIIEIIQIDFIKNPLNNFFIDDDKLYGSLIHGNKSEIKEFKLNDLKSELIIEPIQIINGIKYFTVNNNKLIIISCFNNFYIYK